MRTVKQLPSGIAKETDLNKFPDSTVLNETETSEGTPVVREIYGDVLTNIYKILRFTKNTANGNEDSEDSGYQLFDSLRKLTNILNDAEQQLNLAGTVFSVNIDLSILPNKYVCIARAVDDYVIGSTYSFKGSGSTAIPFSSPVPFKSGDVVLLIIDNSEVRSYSLVPKDQQQIINELFTSFGTPLAFNNSEKLFYQEEGILITDAPDIVDIQSYIRLSASDGTLLVYEMIIVNGFLYCLVFAPGPMNYFIYRSPLTNLSNMAIVPLNGSSFPSGIDNKPNIYTDGSILYISNQTGNSIDDGLLDVYNFNHVVGDITKTGSISLSDFTKSTNTIVKNGAIYDLVNGQFSKYNISSGDKTFVANFPGHVGVIFGFGNNIYFTCGEVSKLWTLLP